MFDDVLDDVVGGVVAAGSLAFAAVILKVGRTPGQGLVAGILAAALPDDGHFLLERLGIRDDLFGLFAFDNGHFSGRDAQLEFEQALVDAAKLPNAQAFVVNGSEIMPLLIHVAGH